MNLHENVIGKGRGAKVNKGFKPGFIGPPLKLPPRKKSSTSSSTLNWGKSQTSVLNSSSVFRSGGSSKSSIDDSECRIVLALTEGRGDARCEVGLATLNVPRATMVLCQISDTTSYINTLTKINILNPCELIVPATFGDSSNKARLLDLIKQHFPVMRIIMFPRSSFNKSNGLERLQYLCLADLKSMLLSLHYKYYALCAASAALIYVQNTLNVYYAADTLKLDYQESEGFAVIDVWTADRLELVSSTRPAQATRYSTLFGVLNNCMTKAGSRTLRSTVLQPPCMPSIIEERLKCVTELIHSPEMMLAIKIILQKVSNIDQLLTITTMFPNDAQHCSYRQLNYLLMLNSVLDHIEPLRDVFNKAQQPFFVELRELLSSNDFNTLRDLVREMVQNDAHHAKGQAGDMQRCYIIKPGVNGLLDSVRRIYSELIDETTKYVKELADKYNLPLTLGNNNSKGYHIILTLKGQQKRYLKKSDLPGEFIQVFRLAGSFTMKTLELINLSTRIDNVMMDIIKLSNLMIYKLLASVKKYIGLFYRLCENIANLDMYQSLAQVSIGPDYAKPVFRDFTDVRFSTHPMLDYLCSTRPIANSFAACNYYNFHIITGPNGSGKSVFIRQVALLQIMAQIGCYVPAQSALFRPADRIYARVYLEDNMECGASAFTLEMKEIKYIMTTMTPHSLIIIDELCRSTSVEEGTALAMSICEKLCLSSAFVYVTTHYTLLTKLQDMYYNIKIWQMETEAFGDKPENTVLDFKYIVQPGVTKLERYGIYMVRNIWPDCLVKQIDKMIDEIRFAPKTAHFMGLDDKLRLKYDLEATFSRLKSEGKLTKAIINTHLNTYVSELEKMKIQLAFETNEVEPNQDFISNLQSNCMLSQMSGLDSLPEFSVHGDWEPGLAEDVLENFTPEIDENLSLKSCDSDLLQENRFFEPYIYKDNVSYDSNYKHVSEYIRENSENISKLVPEVIIESPTRPDILAEPTFCFDYKDVQKPKGEGSIDLTVLSDPLLSPCMSDQSFFQIPGPEFQASYKQKQSYIHSDHLTYIDSNNYMEVYNTGEFAQNEVYPNVFINMISHSVSEPAPIPLNINVLDSIASESSTDKQFCDRWSSDEKIPPNHESKIVGSCVTNNDEFYDKINEAIEELNSCSESFFEEDVDFDLDSSYKSAICEETLPTLGVSDIKPSDTVIMEERDINIVNNRNKIIITNHDEVFMQDCDTSVTDSQKNDDNGFLPHIFPKVVIREGRNDTSKSFGQEGSDFEEMYYSALETDENFIKNNEPNTPMSKLWTLPMKDDLNVTTKHLTYSKYNKKVTFCNKEVIRSTESEESQNKSYNSMVANFDKSLNMADVEMVETTTTEIRETERNCSLSNNEDDEESSMIDDIHASTVKTDRKESDLEVQCTNNVIDDDKGISEKTVQSCSPKKITDNSSLYMIECCHSNESNPGSVTQTVSRVEDKVESNINCNGSQEESSGKYKVTINQTKEDIALDVVNSHHHKTRENIIDSSTRNKVMRKNRAKKKNKTRNKINVTTFFVLENNENHCSSQKMDYADNVTREDETDQTDMETAKEKSSLDCDNSEYRSNNHIELVSTTYNDETQNDNPRSEEDSTKTKEHGEHYNVNNNGTMATATEHEDTSNVSNKVNFSVTVTDSSLENKDKSNIHGPDISSEISSSSQNNETTKHSTSTSSIKESTSSPDAVKRKETNPVKRKFKPPRQIDNSSTPTDDVTCRQKSKRLKLASRFIPPKKLTKREIVEELNKQNRILIEEAEKNPSESSKYLTKWLNTPSVSQIQNATILTHIRKTEEGIIEIPTPMSRKRPRKVDSLPLLRSTSTEKCDVSIFSDKNAIPFEEFIKSKEKDYKLFNFDFKKTSDFTLLPSHLCEGVQSSTGANLLLKNYVRTSSCSNLTVQNVQLLALQEQASMELSAMRMSLTPDGYYKQKTEIETLINKYAREDGNANRSPVSVPSQRRSIFEDATSSEFNL